ncbi:ran-binding protein 3-like isoform X1 [Clavelina lepadiformis]|uniref:ran-binding protein 3-like isoform X1 n=2 Tax=Clavelina lepadiformis TaxID=159417 RepID=UPI0040422021
MAEPSDVKSNMDSSNNAVGGDQIDLSNKPRNMKRPRVGVVGSSTDNSEDNEPDEKRPAFRLHPPTLIHGQAKSVPKASDESTEGISINANNASIQASKCKFLQPSKLSAPSSSNSSFTASGKEHTLASEPLVSSSNPFLKMTEKANSNEQEEKNENANNEAAFGNNQQDGDKVNGGQHSDNSQPDSTTETEIENQDTAKPQSQENLFLQAATNSKSNSGEGGFLFGSKMEERVTMSTEVKPTEKESEDIAASSFVFGQNLADRAKVSSTTDSSQQSLFMLSTSSTQASSSLDSTGDPHPSEQEQSPTSSNSEKKRPGGLEEDAAACFLASQAKPVMPEVHVVTGEENEKNVLQIQCKLHQFDGESSGWVERGVGSLHLNDGKCADDDLNFQSRLVMRIHGSLRLVLNTQVWAQMTVERASKKSVRITAQTEGIIGIFLITATINDAEQIYRALEYRVRHKKQLEEKKKDDAGQLEVPDASSILVKETGSRSDEASSSRLPESAEDDFPTSDILATSQGLSSECINSEVQSNKSSVTENDSEIGVSSSSLSSESNDTVISQSTDSGLPSSDTPS